MLALNDKTIGEFRRWLEEQEYSRATVSKYLHDVRALADYAGGEIADKNHLNGFRRYLEAENYSPGSINSMLGAVNCFLTFLGCDWRLHYVKVQRKTFLPESRELTQREYERMAQTAEALGDGRLAMLLQTLCALGIRVSELRAVTVECLQSGEAVIQNKGKLRPILIPKGLAQKLRAYCRKRGVEHGPIFVTRTGKPLDRSNIWKMLKRLAALAKVAAEKVFPHNLRHLFARTYYQKFKDVVRLADILGHSSIETTRIYTARSGHEERRQLDQLRLILA